MNTAFLLAGQYDGRVVIPLASVARDYFDTTEKTLLAKLERGEVNLPVIRMERSSQKSAKGIHVGDLAAYIDDRRKVARKECEALARTRH